MAHDQLDKLVNSVSRQVLGALAHAGPPPTERPRRQRRLRPLAAANWKMNPCAGSLDAYAAELGRALSEQVDTLLIPPAVLLSELGAALRRAGAKQVLLGAQNLHCQPRGAHTGELSAALLQSVGASWTLVGHSERRQAGERDDDVKRKLEAALGAGLAVMLCVGEQLSERKLGATFPVLRRQVMSALAPTRHQPAAPERLAIAYEPVWAIGTGHVASAAQIAEAMAFIHDLLDEIFGARGPGGGREIRVLYGGSVSAESASDIFSIAGVDGVLVGGASLGASSFARIVRAAAACQLG